MNMVQAERERVKALKKQADKFGQAVRKVRKRRKGNG